MRLILLSVQSVFGDRPKTLPLVIIISLAISLLVSFISINYVLRDRLLADQNRLGPNLLIYPTDAYPGQYTEGLMGTSEFGESFFSLTETDLKAIKKIPLSDNFNVISPKVMGQVQAQNKKNILTKNILLIGVDFEAESDLKPWLKVKGFLPEKANEVVLGNEAAQKLEAEKGDIIYLYDKPFLISGIFREIGTEEDHYLFLDIKQAQKVLAEQITLTDPNFYSYIEINASGSDFDLEKIIEQLEGRLSQMKVVLYQPISFRSSRIEDQFSRFSNTIIFLAVILALFIIFTGIRSYFILKKDEIFYLRSLGFRRFKILQIFFLTVEMISIPAALGGYLIGMLLSLSVTVIVLKRAEIIKIWDPTLLLIAVLVAVLGTFIGMLLNSYRLKEKDLLYELKRNV